MLQRQIIMAHSSAIAAILNTYQLGTADKLAKVGGCRKEHAKKILMGHRPISKKIAIRIRDYTKGRLSVDYLFSLSDGGEG